MGKNDNNQSDIIPESSKIYNQLRSLENVLIEWKEQRDAEERKAEQRFRRWLIQIIIIVTSAIGVIWSAVEMGAWYLDKLQQREMADRYAAVATEMYEQENNPDVALQMLENSIALDDSFETRYQIAYINGMKAVQMLLNLDRPFTREELNAAHKSLADAKFLIQLADDRPEGFILESQIYTALKEYDNAEKAIQQALRLAPDHAFAQVRYATMLYNLKRFDDAEKIIKKVVSAHPENKWGHLWYGLILDAKKDKKAAIARFEAAIALDKKFDTAIYNLGCSYLNSRPRNFVKARECFQRVLTVNPAYRQAYYQLGMSYGYEDRYDVALTYMDKAIALDSDYLTAHNWRALILFEMKRFEEAVEAYSGAIMLDPRNDGLYVRRAAARAGLKQFESAVSDLNFALELNPKNLDAVINLSNIYLQTGNQDLALAQIDNALKSAADDKALCAELCNVRAKIWRKKGDFESAIKDQQKAVGFYKSKYTLYHLANYRMLAQKYADALQTLDEIHKLDARFAPAWKLRVNILKSSDPAAALEALNKYLALRPQDKKMQALKNKLNQELAAKNAGK